MSEKQLNISELIEKLKTGVVNVTFYKLNGEIRDMACTLSGGIIPVDHQPKGDNKRKTSDKNISVYDVEKGAWRSFVKDNVIDWSFDI